MQKCPTCGKGLELTTVIYLVMKESPHVITPIAFIRTACKTKIKASDKQISNALGKLVQRKRICRLGYGMYSL